MIEFSRYDASEFLDSEEVIAEYLSAAIERDDPDAFITALGNVAKARGMAKIAEDTGLGRESLYKSLRPGAKLRYETVQKIVGALGVKMTFAPTKAA